VRLIVIGNPASSSIALSGYSTRPSFPAMRAERAPPPEVNIVITGSNGCCSVVALRREDEYFAGRRVQHLIQHNLVFDSTLPVHRVNDRRGLPPPPSCT